VVGFEEFIQPVLQSTTYRPNGVVETAQAPAMWTLSHRGYGGSGRLDVWGYRSEQDALRAGAELALECGFDEDPAAVDLFESGQYRELLAHYEQHSPPEHLLRVVPAFLQALADNLDEEFDADIVLPSRAEPRPPFGTLFSQRRPTRAVDDDEEGIVLTARNAAVLWHCALQAADDAALDITAFGDSPVHDDPVDVAWRIFDEFPPITYTQDAAWRRQARLAFLELANDLEAGQLPLPRCPAEELALHLILNAAQSWRDDIAPIEVSRILADLRPARRDDDWDYLREVLFRDHDILTLYDDDADGLEDPADPRNQMIAMGDYRPQAWFTTFPGERARPQRTTPPV